MQVRTSKTFLRDCAVTSSLALLLFGGSLQLSHVDNQIVVDGWLKLRAPAVSAVILTQVCPVKSACMVGPQKLLWQYLWRHHWRCICLWHSLQPNATQLARVLLHHLA